MGAMTYLPSLPGDAVLLDVFRAYPGTSRPLLEYHQALLRGPSPLTVAERELIAAYVSGLNACRYVTVSTTRWRKRSGSPKAR
jgi:alkylhydroperoxidase family enzyme